MPTMPKPRGGRRPGAGRPKGSRSTLEPVAKPVSVRLHATVDAEFRGRCEAMEVPPSDVLRRLVEAWLMGRVKL